MKLRQKNPELVSEELTAQDVVNTNRNVIRTDAPTINIEIIESANLKEENKIDKDGGIKTFDEPVLKPDSIELEMHWKRKTCVFTKQKVMTCETSYSDLNHCMSLMSEMLQNNLVF